MEGREMCLKLFGAAVLGGILIVGNGGAARLKHLRRPSVRLRKALQHTVQVVTVFALTACAMLTFCSDTSSFTCVVVMHPLRFAATTAQRKTQVSCEVFFAVWLLFTAERFHFAHAVQLHRKRLELQFGDSLGKQPWRRAFCARAS
eukprot:6308280-Amphidinium_carterae.1